MTDANAVLGRIDPDYFLDGGMALDVEAAERAVDTVAEPLRLSRREAATGILAIINAKMADALRTMTVQQGIDPRSFSLVAFGGAGPMHAIALAEELGIADVVVPWAPGAFSAWGMLHTDLRRDLVRTHYRPPAAIDGAELEEAFAELTAEGEALLAADGVPAERRSFLRQVDMRYAGQEYTITVDAAADVDALVERFHGDYLVRYGHSTPGAPVETVALRLTASGANEWPMAAGAGGSAHVARDPARRAVVFDGEAHDAAIVHRGDVGDGVAGPAIVEEPTSTTVVPPGWGVRLGPAGALVISRSEAA